MDDLDLTEKERANPKIYQTKISRKVRKLLGQYFEVEGVQRRVTYFQAPDGTRLAMQHEKKSQVNLFSHESILADKFLAKTDHTSKYDPLIKYLGVMRANCIILREDGLTPERKYVDFSFLERVLSEVFSNSEDDDNSETVDELNDSGFIIIDVKEPGKFVQHLKRERSVKFRKAVIKQHGKDCEACARDYSTIYGDLWDGFIECHHLLPIARIYQEVTLDVKRHGCVLCANCHRMIHRWMSKEDVIPILKYDRHDLKSFKNNVLGVCDGD